MKRNTLRLAAAMVAAGTTSLAVLNGPIAAQNQAPTGNAAPAPASNANAQANPSQDAAQPAAAATPKAGEAGNVDPNKVVLTVGNEKVTAGEVEALVADLSSQQRQMLKSAGRRVLADELVKVKLLAQEAQRRGLTDSPKVKRQLELARNQILASAVAADVQRKHYDQNKQQFEKVRARHILVRTPGSRAPVRPGQKELSEQEAKAKADDLRKQIAGGADFGDVARKESDDTVSGAQGGDLGEFGHGQMVAEFDQVAFSLKPGEVSAPIKTQFGWHIIQVQDQLSFNDVQRDVAARSEPQLQQLLTDLKKNTKVDVDESYFGPAVQPPGAPALPGAAAPAPAPGAGSAPGQQPRPAQPAGPK